jgi:hypothetical protein
MREEDESKHSQAWTDLRYIFGLQVRLLSRGYEFDTGLLMVS